MAPAVPLSLTKRPRSLMLQSTPTSLKYSGAGPYPVYSGAENQRAVRPPSQRGWPLNSRGPESHLCLPVPAMAALAQQTSPHPRPGSWVCTQPPSYRLYQGPVGNAPPPRQPHQSQQSGG